MTAKRVLVTGASRGIGRAIALRLARDGWSVAVHYNVDRDAALETVRELADQAAGLYQADLADAPASALIDQVAQDGPVQALVNNAGIYVPLDFAGADEETFESNFR